MIYVYQVKFSYWSEKTRFLFGGLNATDYDDGSIHSIEEHQSREPHVNFLLETE